MVSTTGVKRQPLIGRARLVMTGHQAIRRTQHRSLIAGRASSPLIELFHACVSVGSCAYQVSVLSGVGIDRPMMVSEVPTSECHIRGSLRSEDHSRTGAPAIAVTSPWQERLSAQTRRNLLWSDQEAVTAASLVDQRNSVPSRHIRWRMMASLRATATVAFLWPIFRASRSPQREIL